jgi:hypothetical protein
MVCERLCTITKLPLQLAQAQCEWGPVHHRASDTHGECKGVVNFGADGHWCEKCKRVVGESEVIAGTGSCLGSRIPIRTKR